MNKKKTSLKKVSSANAKQTKFPIVGIGASAGGLEAFTKLLKHLPADTGMGFVLVQHLSPQHESFLSEILARVSPMAVVEADNGVLIEPNHVYVIPPNVGMTVKGGCLQLIPRGKSERPHLAIDYFFRSLALDQKNDAIGVVLSGTGSDGAEGLKTIKGEGGITFAQLPESAKFAGMPQRAITVDHVDFVLPPEGIAKELINISKHPYLRETLPSEDGSPESTETERDEVDKILRIIRQSTGADFSQYKRTTVHRRIMRRMVVHKLESFSKYRQLLKDNRTEQTALHNDILINVTSFFRNPEVFEKMQAVVFPKLLKGRKEGEPIRVWVPGCATGEEVYSIAISLLEFLDEKHSQQPIQIFGSDLSDSCIAKARAGKYMEGISEDVSKDRLNRFFVRSDKGYLVGKAVRDLCVFAKQDIINDPPYSRLDLISCRNVLIYFEPALQRRVLNIFRYALKPSGFLVLGTSETPNTAAALFNTVEKKEKIYSANSSATQVRPTFKGASQPEQVFAQATKRSPQQDNDPIEREIDQLIVNQFAPPSVVVNGELEIIQFRGDTTPYLVNQSKRPSFQILKMAREGLAPALKSLLEEAKRKGSATRSEEITLHSGKSTRAVWLEAIPLRSSNLSFYIVFRESLPRTSSAAADAKGSKSGKNGRRGRSAGRGESERASELARQLAETRVYLESMNRDLESTNQDLQSANEEVLSANEELQSTNEELETAKEELQSGNEELTTVNDELQSRNAELDRLNNDLINLLGSVEIPILMIGRDGRIRKITPAAERALSLQSTDVGRPIREIKSNFEFLGLDLHLEDKVAEVVSSMTAGEMEIRDRNQHWYRLQIRPYRTLDNRIDGAVVALIDIDALKRSVAEIETARNEADKARAAAEAGNRAKDLFLATLSHELRTPLTTILSYAQLLRMGKVGPENAKRGILMIEQSAQTQAQLINDLLDVSRIMMGKMSLDVQDVDPIAVLHATVESIRPLAERKPVHIKESLGDREALIRADAVRLKQVILNLLTNAIKFSLPDGTIDVSVSILPEATGEMFRLDVRDFGKGISEKFLPHLFDRFSQADSTSTRVHGGMGLGLAIVRSLTEAQGGAVHVESAGEGKGSTFSVAFPLVEREPIERLGRGISLISPRSDDLGTNAERVHPSLNGVKVLLVDDDPGARESVGALLTSLGAEVTVAESAPEALELLAKLSPDVLLSDLAMPGEDGFSLVKRLREHSSKRLRNLPALALTAFAGLDDVRRALAAGFQAHLAKPVNSLELARAVADLAKSDVHKKR